MTFCIATVLFFPVCVGCSPLLGTPAQHPQLQQQSHQENLSHEGSFHFVLLFEDAIYKMSPESCRVIQRFLVIGADTCDQQLPADQIKVGQQFIAFHMFGWQGLQWETNVSSTGHIAKSASCCGGTMGMLQMASKVCCQSLFERRASGHRCSV